MSVPPVRSRVAARRVVSLVAILLLVAVGVTGLSGLAWLQSGKEADNDAMSRVGQPIEDVEVGEPTEDGYAVWERNDDGTPVRWDPCAPIEFVLNPASAPAGARADLDEALERLRAVTGLDLVVLGETDERPTGARVPYQPHRYGDRWAPVLVAWTTPGVDGVALRVTDRGIAVPVAVGPPGDRAYVTAQVALNADRRDLQTGFDDRATSWGATLLHELAHVLGLAHVDDPDELMSTNPGTGPVALRPGDVAGLRAVGAKNGCRPSRAPGPVTLLEPPPS